MLIFVVDGPILLKALLCIQVNTLLGRSDSNIRDTAAAAGVELYRHEANNTIRRLVTMQVIRLPVFTKQLEHSCFVSTNICIPCTGN